MTTDFLLTDPRTTATGGTMTDLETLWRRLDAAARGLNREPIYSLIADAAEGIIQLRERLAAAERDAARYRWLRDKQMRQTFAFDDDIELDAAIDRAMEGK